MNRRAFCIIAVACLFTIIASPAQAMHHARLGRFVQRDPIGQQISTPMPRVGTAGAPGASSGFIPRDRINPLLQYADGMNTYQYVRSRPISMYDPSGLEAIEQSQVWIECRPVGEGGDSSTPSDIAGALGFVHCSIVSCCEYANGRQCQRFHIGGAEKGNTPPKHGGDTGQRYEIGDGWSDKYEVTLPDNNLCCSIYECLVEAHKSTTPPPYNKYGPNSNTYAHGLLKACNLKMTGYYIWVYTQIGMSPGIHRREWISSPPGAYGWNMN